MNRWKRLPPVSESPSEWSGGVPPCIMLRRVTFGQWLERPAGLPCSSGRWAINGRKSVSASRSSLVCRGVLRILLGGTRWSRSTSCFNRWRRPNRSPFGMRLILSGAPLIEEANRLAKAAIPGLESSTRPLFWPERKRLSLRKRAPRIPRCCSTHRARRENPRGSC